MPYSKLEPRQASRTHQAYLDRDCKPDGSLRQGNLFVRLGYVLQRHHRHSIGDRVGFQGRRRSQDANTGLTNTNNKTRRWSGSWHVEPIFFVGPTNSSSIDSCFMKHRFIHSFHSLGRGGGCTKLFRPHSETIYPPHAFQLCNSEIGQHLTSCILRSAVRAFLSSAVGSSSRYTLSAVAISLNGIPTAVLNPSWEETTWTSERERTSGWPYNAAKFEHSVVFAKPDCSVCQVNAQFHDHTQTNKR